jgi:hypothetical protein
MCASPYIPTLVSHVEKVNTYCQFEKIEVARWELVRAREVLMALGHAHLDPAVDAATRPNGVRCFAGARSHMTTSVTMLYDIRKCRAALEAHGAAEGAVQSASGACACDGGAHGPQARPH